MVWTMLLQLLAILFGRAMYPRKKGDGPNEIPYDENEMVIGAWMNYFASIGLKPAFAPHEPLAGDPGLHAAPRAVRCDHRQKMVQSESARNKKRAHA